MRNALGVEHSQRQNRGRRLRAVDERESFLRLELNRHEPASFQRHRAGQPAVGTEGLALTDQHQRQMREGREIAARADRSTARDDRVHAARSAAR